MGSTSTVCCLPLIFSLNVAIAVLVYYGYKVTKIYLYSRADMAV